MKIDYEKLGRESMGRLKDSTSRAQELQVQLLQRMLESNKNTAYGKKYEFSTIDSVKKYQEKVPLSDYSSYDPYIQAMLEGKENQLTEKPPVYYCISSGSVGLPKYLPVSEADLLVHFHFTYGTVFGMVREYYSHKKAEDIFGKIFQIGEFVKTHTDRGVMNGIRSAALYQWLDKDENFDVSDYTAPKEILFPSGLVDLTYIKVRFALAERSVKAIHGVFAHHVAGMMQYIEKNWELLLKDMELGTIDERIRLSEEWREKVRKWLPPNPVRAEELRAIVPATLSENMIQKIWKQTQYILAIGGNTLKRYAEKLKCYAGDIPIHHFVYGASEGMMGIASGLDRPDSYILIPDAGFFEFIPVEEEEAPLTLSQVKVGEQYRLVYTNLSGLYRYCMGDVIKIEGFYYESPVISYCYRENQILNIVDEKTNTEQLERAVEEFEKIAFVTIVGYCVAEDESVFPERYLIYVECAGQMKEEAEQKLEDCLCQMNYGYQSCRKMNQIGHLKLQPLKPGAFFRYKNFLAQRGYEMGQNKPVKVLNSEDSKAFFSREIQL